MALSHKQFDILEVLATNDEAFSQRELEEKTGHSLGSVNKTVKELTDLGFIDDGKITDKDDKNPLSTEKGDYCHFCQ